MSRNFGRRRSISRPVGVRNLCCRRVLQSRPSSAAGMQFRSTAVTQRRVSQGTDAAAAYLDQGLLKFYHLECLVVGGGSQRVCLQGMMCSVKTMEKPIYIGSVLHLAGNGSGHFKPVPKRATCLLHASVRCLPGGAQWSYQAAMCAQIGRKVLGSSLCRSRLLLAESRAPSTQTSHPDRCIEYNAARKPDFGLECTWPHDLGFALQA